MKNAMSWVQYIATHILIFTCIYAWKIQGVEGAGNLVQDILGTFAAGIAGFSAPDVTIVQRAHGRNYSRKEVICSTGQAKERARSKHRLKKQHLAEACDNAVRKSGAQP